MSDLAVTPGVGKGQDHSAQQTSATKKPRRPGGGPTAGVGELPPGEGEIPVASAAATVAAAAAAASRRSSGVAADGGGGVGGGVGGAGGWIVAGVWVGGRGGRGEGGRRRKSDVDIGRIAGGCHRWRALGVRELGRGACPIGLRLLLDVSHFVLRSVIGPLPLRLVCADIIDPLH